MSENSSKFGKKIIDELFFKKLNLPREKRLVFEREDSFTRPNIFAAGDLAFSFAAAFDALQLMCLSIKKKKKKVFWPRRLTGCLLTV